MTSETVAAEFGKSPEPAGAQSAGTQPGAPTGSLRTWQRRALTKYLSSSPRDFLAVATPGAGKTTFALRVASELLRDRTVDQITVVAPTEHLKHQWAESAQRSGLALDSRFSNSTGQTSSDYHGVVLTYAQVASHPSKHRVRTEGRKTLVIWRKRPGGETAEGIEQDNLVLDEWFTRQGYSSKDSEFDLIYVNGDNNLENLKAPDDTWKVRLIEDDFHRLMFEMDGV